ncbi:MAG: (Fe-S)-binding protein [Dehalococcoidales bacterium]|nr:(Fe-S)-binding protein [Dehalococcoidales bacterium]
MSKKPRVQDISKPGDEQLINLDPNDLMKLPHPYDDNSEFPPLKPLKEAQKGRLEHALDGHVAIGIPKPQTEEEKRKYVEMFLSGLQKLLNKDDNWTFYQQLMLTMENCTRCQTCSEACPVFVSSGRQEPYRPTYRAEVLRRIVKRYLTPGGKFFGKFTGADIDLTWDAIARLAELSYRCTICRRCAQTCPIGVDNGLITHELRKLFSQEMGIAAAELHRLGSVKHLETGSSTGMTPAALMDTIEFMEEEVEEKTGMKFKWPVDKEGADILLIHNAGEFLSWPENPEAFAILFEKAGINYTLSSELVGYDGVNYGLWYDDVQFARVALKHLEVAKKLGVKKIVIGECGHAHKALTVIADRVMPEELNIPRESCYVLFDEIVRSGKLSLDPRRNNFPVTLHDPCNIVRLMGIVEPQRRVLRKIAPRFREMTPHGVENYCCGGGSGFAIMQGLNFPDWRNGVSGRMKMKQILGAFEKELDSDEPKYICAPCSNCKGQLRGLLEYYNAGEKSNIRYTGLVELIINAMTDFEKPFLNPEEDF